MHQEILLMKQNKKEQRENKNTGQKHKNLK
jgi:hypothetical protein